MHVAMLNQGWADKESKDKKALPFARSARMFSHGHAGKRPATFEDSNSDGRGDKQKRARGSVESDPGSVSFERSESASASTNKAAQQFDHLMSRKAQQAGAEEERQLPSLRLPIGP